MLILIKDGLDYNLRSLSSIRCRQFFNTTDLPIQAFTTLGPLSGRRKLAVEEHYLFFFFFFYFILVLNRCEE